MNPTKTSKTVKQRKHLKLYVFYSPEPLKAKIFSAFSSSSSSFCLISCLVTGGRNWNRGSEKCHRASRSFSVCRNKNLSRREEDEDEEEEEARAREREREQGSVRFWAGFVWLHHHHHRQAFLFFKINIYIHIWLVGPTRWRRVSSSPLKSAAGGDELISSLLVRLIFDLGADCGLTLGNRAQRELGCRVSLPKGLYWDQSLLVGVKPVTWGGFDWRTRVGILCARLTCAGGSVDPPLSVL